MPIITLEVMTNHSEEIPTIVSENDSKSQTSHDTGIHFLSETEDKAEENGEAKESAKKSEQFDYVMRNDGSVVCKVCGEILQSRTHWYRHKYKLHVMPPLNPAPLFQCEQCLVYFKSRKGYIGHVASRHSEALSDSNPVVSKPQVTGTIVKPLEPSLVGKIKEIKEEPDFEMALPKSTVPNYQMSVVKVSPNKPTEAKKIQKKESSQSPGWEERRSREEKLVADIIDRVKRECEAQGTGGARRGYTRRTTVMHT